MRSTPDDAPEGRHYLHRPGEMIVHQDDADLIAGRLVEVGAREAETTTENTESTERLRGLGFERWVVDSDDDDFPGIIAALRRPFPVGDSESAEEIEPRVFPNIVVRLHRHKPWHSASGRTPAPPLSDLPRRSWLPLPGAGVTVGVLDTGIDGAIPTDPNDPTARGGWFAGRCHTRVNDVDADPLGRDGDVPGALSVDDGHGTSVSSIVLRYAPGATVKVRRFPNDRDELDDVQLSQAIEDLAAEGVDIINLACGGPTHEGTTLPATEAAIDRLLKANPRLAIVASAGNANGSAPYFPAALKTVFGVGATESASPSTARSGFSNYGWWVDACAPGTDVHSAFVHWPAVGTEPAFHGGVTWSGTSFAAPAVAGSIAAHMSPGGLRGLVRRLLPFLFPKKGARQAAFSLVGDPRKPRVPEVGTLITSRSYAD